MVQVSGEVSNGLISDVVHCYLLVIGYRINRLKDRLVLYVDRKVNIKFSLKSTISSYSFVLEVH